MIAGVLSLFNDGEIRAGNEFSVKVDLQCVAAQFGGDCGYIELCVTGAVRYP